VREAANRAQCLNNLKQIALAAHNYHDAKHRFPTGARLPVYVGDRPTGATNLWVELLPYFEQGNLYKRWDYSDTSNNNRVGGRNATTAQVIKILLCPSDPLPENVVEVTGASPLPPPWSWGFYGMSSYGGSAGKRSLPSGGPPAFPDISRDGIYFIDSCVRLTDITDGSSNTLLFGERYHRDPEYDLRQPMVLPGVGQMAERGRWGWVAGPGVMGEVMLHTAAPINYRVPPGGDRATLQDRQCTFGSGHGGGANFAFADGSVRFLSESMPLATLQALSTRAGGEVVPGDF